MKKKTELSKILKSYVLMLTFAVCAIGLLCGSIIAGNNTKALSSGEKAATAGIQTDDRVTLSIDQKQIRINLSPLDKYKELSACAPAPIGNIIFLMNSINEFIEDFS